MKESKPKSPHIKREEFSDRNISPLESHPQAGKTLKNPFSIIPRPLVPRSWINECIPNILWACILASELEREHYLRLFRTVVFNTRERLTNYDDVFITHNHLTRLSVDDFDIVFKDILDDQAAAKVLRSLLLVTSLPDLSHWERRLEKPEQSHWSTLAHAVAASFDHQSQKATDIRWLKLIHMAVIGRVQFGGGQSGIIEELRLYPSHGDMRAVRPTIRSMELAFRSFEFGEEGNLKLPPSHQERFWEDMHSLTVCIPHDDRAPPIVGPKCLTRQLLDLGQNLAKHFHDTIQHTSIDARHDFSFGLVFYAIHLLTEACVTYSHSTALGRQALRAIVECLITLSYLAKKDNPELWLKHRDYGAGQAKLSFLKNLRADAVPRFVDLKRLELLANEDKWLEFQDINLGAWSDINLRSMATEAGVKELYDSYFDLCSAYTHGHWGGLRDFCFFNMRQPPTSISSRTRSYQLCDAFDFAGWNGPNKSHA